MKKKLLALILISVLCVSVFSGCILFDRNNKKDYAQIVAEIRNVLIDGAVPRDPKNPTAEELANPPVYFSKDITKRDLVIAYLNYGQQQAQQSGAGLRESLNMTLDQLIAKELIIARYSRIINSGELDRAYEYEENGVTKSENWRQRDFNKAWKAVYDYCDNQIASIETAMYTTKGLNAPQKGEGSGEPQYPANTLETKTWRDMQDEIDKRADVDPFEFNPANRPRETDVFRLDAAKRFITMMIQQVSDISLDPSEQAALKADKDFINRAENRTEIYAKIMGNANINNPFGVGVGAGFFCIRKLIAESQFDQVKYERMQDYYNTHVTVSDKEVQDYYDNTLEAQKIRFDEKNAGYIDTYFNALKDTQGTPFVFYHPTSDVFYVKHILVPFSSEQTARITAFGNGNTIAAQRSFQNGLANDITAHPRVNGNDDTSRTIGVRQIFDDVRSVMEPLRNAPSNSREREFTKLIHKYNTDPGAFNNELGYIMPPKGSGIASGFMQEFEDGAYELWDDHGYNAGAVLNRYATTSYGVHIMYYSSHTKKGVTGLRDWTSGMQLQTYGDAVRDFLLQRKQTDNFNLIQSQIVNEYTKEGSGHVTKFERRYADLFKNR